MVDKSIAVYSGQAAHLTLFRGLRVREDVAYTDTKGSESKRFRRRAEKCLGNLQAVLARVIQADEAIFYLVRCDVKPSLLEQLTAGVYVRYYSRVVLVLTNQRLLALIVSRDGRWRGSLCSLAWGDVGTWHVKGWISRVLVVEGRSGHTDKYWRLRRTDARKIRGILDVIMRAAAGCGTPFQSAVSLCPSCVKPLDSGVYQCINCGQIFKDESKLWWRTILIPGGGYFYTGQTVAGIMHFIGELYLIVVLLVSVHFFLSTTSLSASGGGLTHSAEDYLAVMIGIAALLMLEKSGTIFHCRKVVRRFVPVK